MTSPQGEAFPIPWRLNLVLLLGASLLCASLLWAASHADSVAQRVIAALLFSFAANTLFSLLHEAVHGVLHPHRAVNAWAGRLAAAFFPTAFALQRGFHLTHHKNNRTETERFDYLQAGDVRWLKRAQWYAILTGVYWLVSVLGVLTYLLVPRVLRLRFLRARESRAATQTAAREYLAVLDGLHPLWSRAEILLTVAIQAALFVSLDLTLTGWLSCYAAFGFHWSSLQYADHAFSPLDPIEGAWNLRANPVSRLLFLNYHYHLAHHQSPRVPWIHLGRLVDPGAPQPSHLGMWLAMWRGPRPLPTTEAT